jgi:hypothetical protein
MAVAVGDTLGFPAKFIVVRTDQVIRTPDWATYARMGATGLGGNGANTNSGAGGGGGGGFAGTNIFKASPGALITVRFTSTGTIVDGLGYLLTGGAGGTPPVNGVGGTAGVGSGGDINFIGGAGGTATSGWTGAGGSAAGRGGPGQAGGAGSGTNGNGSAGCPSSGYLSGSSTGGSANSVVAVDNPALTSIGQLRLLVGFTGGNTANNSVAGGDGGAGGAGITASSPYTNTGGAGFALLEFW